MFNKPFLPFDFMDFRKNNRGFCNFLAFFSISAKVVLLQGVQILAGFVLFIAIRGNFLEDIRGVWAVF